MSEHSQIEWTDATWNPIRGCTKISPGCTNCYAETFAERFRGVPGHPYEQGFDLKLIPEKLNEPVRFLSIEPLLEDLGWVDFSGIHWVIVGGESGHGARPMHIDWVRSLRDQCAAAG